MTVTAIAKAPSPAPQQPVTLTPPKISTLQDLISFGKVLAESGFFKDSRGAAQAVVKVQAGLELGIPPIAAMTGIHVIEGKIALSATLLAALVKRSGKYDYRATHEKDACVVVFLERGEEIGRSSFSLADAERAGLAGRGPWKTYLRNMLFARALSNGVRWYCPDVFAGPIYTPEELGAEIDGDGEVTRVAVVEPVAVAPEEKPKPQRKAPAAALAHAERVLEANDLDTLTHVSQSYDRAGLDDKVAFAIGALEQMHALEITGADVRDLDERATKAANWLLAQLPRAT
jgi:hypothetical protein